MNIFANGPVHNQGARNFAHADCFALFAGRPFRMADGQFFKRDLICALVGALGGFRRLDKTGSWNVNSDSPPL
jgi:hypothetical protein